MATENNNKTLNVPNLRFPEFSEEWERKKLGDIGTTLIGLTYSPLDVVPSDGTIVLRSSNIKGGLLDYTDLVRVNKKIKESIITRANDILICARNGSARLIGKNAILKDSDCGHTFGAFMMVYRSEDNPFVHQLLSTKRYYSQVAENLGARINQITTSDLNSFEFSFPQSKKEKVKIAGMLSLLDERIATQIKIIEKFESLIKGLCQTLFNFEEYTTCFLGDICSITTGKLDANAMVEDGKYPFFTCAEDVFSIDEYAFDTEALLISGNGANLGYIHYYNGKFNAYQRTYVLDKFAIDINYVRLYLESFLKYRIEQEKNTGNTPYIVLGTLSKMKIKVPNTITQQKISQSIASLKEKLSIEKHSLKKYEEQKKYLLSNLFI